jgi:hypothetical protein
MRAKTVYYTAFGLKDGTVFGAMPVRKPRRTRHGPAPAIDPEGVCRFYVEDVAAPADLPEWKRATFHAAVSTALNVRRIVMTQLAGRLAALEKGVAETRE